jgi:hypothetical protein
MVRVDDVTTTQVAIQKALEEQQRAQALELTDDERRKIAERVVAEAAMAAQSAQNNPVQDVKTVDAAKEIDKVEIKKDTRLTGYKENINAQDLATQQANKELGGLTVRELQKQNEQRLEKQEKIKA